VDRWSARGECSDRLVWTTSENVTVSVDYRANNFTNALFVEFYAFLGPLITFRICTCARYTSTHLYLYSCIYCMRFIVIFLTTFAFTVTDWCCTVTITLMCIININLPSLLDWVKILFPVTHFLLFVTFFHRLTNYMWIILISFTLLHSSFADYVCSNFLNFLKLLVLLPVRIHDTVVFIFRFFPFKIFLDISIRCVWTVLICKLHVSHSCSTCTCFPIFVLKLQSVMFSTQKDPLLIPVWSHESHWSPFNFLI